MTKYIFRAIFNPLYGLYILAKKYIIRYEGFSYSFKKNGEEYLLDKLISSDIKTVFDVGANIGNWTEIAHKKFSNSTIHAFEISEKTFKVLKRRYQDNSQIVLNNFGLSDKSGEFEYKDYGKNSGVNSLILDSDFHDSQIKSKILKTMIDIGDEYCLNNNVHSIDFLKIDVEGAEHLVLGGFTNLLKSGKIKVIQFEYGYTHADAKFLIKDFYKLFNSFEYVLGPLKPSGVIFMDFDYALNDFNSGPNYVAVHKNQIEIINSIKGKPIKGFPRLKY
jgi:FkbM family methyltransferase